tara:strand:+ start:1500 stop:1778 length:279 start_codon:yes stop_codon:yes gene_type:complete
MKTLNQEKMEVIGYDEDRDAFYYFDDATDNMVSFPIKGDVRSAATSLFDKVSQLADVVAYSSSMDFEFPDKYGRDSLNIFNNVGKTYYPNDR